MFKNKLEFERRHLRKTGSQHNYGWTQGKSWWDYTHPKYPSGPDKDGWGGFITAVIWAVGSEVCYSRPGTGDPNPYVINDYAGMAMFLGISYGCHWDGSERFWGPCWSLRNTLEEAMDFCEWDMVRHGTLPPFGE